MVKRSLLCVSGLMKCGAIVVVMASMFMVAACAPRHVYDRANVAEIGDGWREVSVKGSTRHPKDHVVGAMLLKMAEQTKAEKKHFFLIKDTLGKGYDQYLVRSRYGVEQSRSFQGKLYRFTGQFQPIFQKEVAQYIGKKAEGLRIMDAAKITKKYEFLRLEAQNNW
jgi:hypothetical protein